MRFEKIFLKIPFSINFIFSVFVPSSSIDFVPIPSGMCGLSVKLNSSVAILFLKLFEKQLFFSLNVLKLNYPAITNANNSPTE